MKNYSKEWKLGKLGISFWTHFKSPMFDLTISKCGYFDGRPELQMSLVIFTFVFHLPWINKKWMDECDPPKYGIAIHGDTFWIYTGGYGNDNGGGTWWTWDIPFFTKNFYKKYILGKNGEWIDITSHKFNDEGHKLYHEKIGYLDWNTESKPSDEDSLAKTFYDKWEDKYDGSLIDAKYRVEIFQWRPKWLKWTSKFQITKKSINVCFKEEVGSKKGSWKGGVIGAGYDFKDDKETPEECFKRMNKEKDW